MTAIFEPTRAKLAEIVAAFQAANYPSIEFNYPKRWVTDVEHCSTYFVGVEWQMSSQGRSIPAHQCVTVSGILAITQYCRANSGQTIFTQFSDKLSDYLGLKTINGITFYEVNPHEDSGRPGFDGVMNVVNFYIDYFNI